MPQSRVFANCHLVWSFVCPVSTFDSSYICVTFFHRCRLWRMLRRQSRRCSGNLQRPSISFREQSRCWQTHRRCYISLSFAALYCHLRVSLFTISCASSIIQSKQVTSELNTCRCCLRIKRLQMLPMMWNLAGLTAVRIGLMHFQAGEHCTRPPHQSLIYC